LRVEVEYHVFMDIHCSVSFFSAKIFLSFCSLIIVLLLVMGEYVSFCLRGFRLSFGGVRRVRVVYFLFFRGLTASMMGHGVVDVWVGRGVDLRHTDSGVTCLLC